MDDAVWMTPSSELESDASAYTWHSEGFPLKRPPGDIGRPHHQCKVLHHCPQVSEKKTATRLQQQHRLHDYKHAASVTYTLKVERYSLQSFRSVKRCNFRNQRYDPAPHCSRGPAQLARGVGARARMTAPPPTARLPTLALRTWQRL